MLTTVQTVVIIGALVNAVGTSFYIRDIFAGKTRPNKMTFLMWSIAPLIGGVAALFRGATWSTVPVFVAGLWPLAIFIVAIGVKSAYWKLNRTDYIFGVWSALAIILWLITEEPNVAILFAILADWFAANPTLVKAWKHPDTELAWPYLASSFSGLTGVFVASSFTFAQVAFPIYLFVMMGLIGLVALRSKRS